MKRDVHFAALLSLFFAAPFLSAAWGQQTVTGQAESKPNEGKPQVPKFIKPVKSGTLKPGECIRIHGVAANGGSASITGYGGAPLNGANITINGTGNCTASVNGSGCTIQNNLGGTPATGSLNISGSNNTINCASPGAPDGGTTTINIFATSPPVTTPGLPANTTFSGNSVVSAPGVNNQIKTMGYDANGQPVEKNTIIP